MAILIHKSIPFQINSTTLDPGGKCTILQSNLFGHYLNLGNIYGPNSENCYYSSIIISDHATVSIEYRTLKEFRGPPRWRFDTKWLQDPEFIHFMDQQIELFFQVNKSETSPFVRWKAFKVFIRGQIISYSSYSSYSAGANPSFVSGRGQGTPWISRQLIAGPH